MHNDSSLTGLRLAVGSFVEDYDNKVQVSINMLNCKINSTNRRTISKSADKILVRIFLFLRAIIMSK